jgi:hypothetical protein
MVIQSFFIGWLIEREGNKLFFSLKDGEGIITRDENLLRHATQYYKELFGSGNGNAFNLDSGLWPQEDSVIEEENLHLTKPFEENEIEKALFLMEKNKASGKMGTL